MAPIVKYTILRIGLFAVVLAILIIVGVPGWLAAIAAALVALSVSYIFFRRQRDAAISSLRKSHDSPAAASDEQAEDR